jgi:hypothetical protein
MSIGAMDQLAALPPIISVEDTCRLLGLSRSAGRRRWVTWSQPGRHLRPTKPASHLR